MKKKPRSKQEALKLSEWYKKEANNRLMSMNVGGMAEYRRLMSESDKWRQYAQTPSLPETYDFDGNCDND